MFACGENSSPILKANCELLGPLPPDHLNDNCILLKPLPEGQPPAPEALRSVVPPRLDPFGRQDCMLLHVNENGELEPWRPSSERGNPLFRPVTMPEPDTVPHYVFDNPDSPQAREWLRNARSARTGVRQGASSRTFVDPLDARCILLDTELRNVIAAARFPRVTPRGFAGATLLGTVLMAAGYGVTRGYEAINQYFGRSEISGLESFVTGFSPIGALIGIQRYMGVPLGTGLGGAVASMAPMIPISYAVAQSQEILDIDQESVGGLITGWATTAGLGYLAAHATITIGGTTYSAAGAGLTALGVGVGLAEGAGVGFALAGGVLLGTGWNYLSGATINGVNNLVSDREENWMGNDGTLSDLYAAGASRLVGAREDVAHRSVRDVPEDELVTWTAEELANDANSGRSSVVSTIDRGLIWFGSLFGI
ncbi:MAG: hypothetical protein ABH859_00850 [Pseudomonadota bacterium]